MPLQVALFIAVPPPASHSVGAWFDLFNGSPVIGLLSLDLLMMVEQVLAVPIILALFLLPIGPRRRRRSSAPPPG